MIEGQRKTSYLKNELYSLIKEDELFFERILEDGLDGVCYWDVNNQNNKWSNPKFWKALGYEKHEIPNAEQNWQSIIHPEDLKAVLKNVDESEEKSLHHFNGTVRYQHKKGTWVWFRTMGVIIRDKVNDKPRLLATYINVTNQKESEIHFEKLVKRYESVIEGTNIGVWEWDLQTKTVLFNERWAKILGYDINEVEPHESTWEKLTHPEDHKKAIKALEKYFSGEIDSYVFESRMKHKEGHWVWVIDRAKVIKWAENGKPLKVVGYHRDITTRKNNELLLLEYKKLLEHTNEVARIGTWEVNLQQNTVHWSKVTKQIAEVDENYIPTLEDAYSFYLEGEYRDKIIKHVEDAIEKGIDYDVECKIITSSGKVKWSRTIGISEFKNGECIKLYGLFQDIDDFKKAQLDLALREEQFRQTFTHAAVGMCIVSIDGKLINANKSLCKIIGYSEAELKTKSLIELSHPEDVSLSKEKVKAILANKIESYQVEKRYIHKSGEVIWANSTISAVKDDSGRFLHFVAQVQDITYLKRALDEIAFNEEQFRRTFEYAANGMSIVNTEGKFLKVNRSLCDFLGYSESELLNLNYQEITHSDDLERDVTFMQEMLANKRDRYQLEKRYIHKNGTYVWALLSVSLIKDSNNKPLHFVSHVNNISQRKLAENNVANLLAVTKERNKRLMNFAHIVSHNLRSHSGNMSMLIDLIKMQAPELMKNEFFPLLNDAISNLHETIEHLNEVSVINTKTEENLELLNLTNYVDNALKNVNLSIKEVKAIIDKDIPSGTKVMGLPAYLDSILLNIITNAIKYRSPERQLLISIKARKENNFVTLEITDNGLGIDLKKHGEKIFGMYKTFHSHDDARGVGLFITKNQIESLGGKIEVSSIVNQTTSFKIYFRYENN
jgi:PAS domain S-box-containing protein